MKKEETDSKDEIRSKADEVLLIGIHGMEMYQQEIQADTLGYYTCYTHTHELAWIRKCYVAPIKPNG